MSILRLEKLLENQLETTGELNPNAPQTRLHLPTGQTVVVPTHLLLNGSELRNSSEAVANAERETGPVASPAVAEEERLSGTSEDRHPAATDETVIPLVAEQIAIGKREVERARVHLRRDTEEFVQHVNVPLSETKWEVEHVPMNQVVSEAPQIRQVGDVTIFPLMEERLIVTREMFLREEVHLRKVVLTTEKSADYSLKRDILVETRTEAQSGPSSSETLSR